MGVPVSYNLRNLIERKGTTLMTALGIGLTVAVLVVVLALLTGLQAIFAGTGDPKQIIVLRKGTDAELPSTVSNEAYQIIRRLPGIAAGQDGEPLVSPEGLTVINLPSIEAPAGTNVTVRGMLPIGLSMRQVTVVSGAMIKPGLRQVVVGESVAKRYPGAQVGKELRFGRGMWTVVGVFRVGDTAANSEIWTDLNQLRGDFEQSGGSSSLLIRATDEEAVKSLLKTIDEDQRLNMTAKREKDYYAGMTAAGIPLVGLGSAVAIIMAIGSAFAATNTMYAAVARRTREIGTLRALGFGRWAILRSFMLESVILALLGGILGILIALPINGLSTGMTNWGTFSETAFKFRVSPLGIGVGLLFATIIGTLGGLLPAWSASRKNMIQAMRDL